MGRARTSEPNGDTFSGVVALNIIRMREKRKLKATEAAELAGIPVTAWYRLEAGESNRIAGERLDELMRFFECTRADLVKPPKA